MSARRGAARALENQLSGHEFAVVFADGSGGWRETGVGRVGTPGPFPDVTEHATSRARDYRSRDIELVANVRVGEGCEVLPFSLGREPRSSPSREGVSLVKAHIRDWRRPVDLAPTTESELALLSEPIERCGDAFLLDPGPAIRKPKSRRAVTGIFDERIERIIVGVASQASVAIVRITW